MEFRQCVAMSLQKRETTIVDRSVACADIPAWVADAERMRNRALLFDSVEGRSASVVGNLFGSAGRICQAFSVKSYTQLFRRLEQAIERPSSIRRAQFPVGDYDLITDPDLLRLLPAIRYCREDATPYLTSGIVLVRYPGSRRHHACFVRMAVVGENRLLVNPGTPRIRQIVAETVGKGEELDVAIIVGAPTELILMACTTMPGEQDKLEVAQALAGDSLIYADDDLPVPIGAEYVLRGKIVPRYEKEGPFGEVGGVYSVKENNPVCVIDRMWQRRNPIFHSISAGTSREHLELLSLGPRSYLERIRRAHRKIIRYSLPGFGADRLAVLVVKDGFDPRILKERLWNVPIVRGFVFVNEDVASRSAPDLLWAVLQRASNRDHFNFSDQRHPVYNTDKFFVDATVADLSALENRRVGVYGAA